MSRKSEIACLELIVRLNSTVFPDHFDIRNTILTQVVTKIWSVEDPLMADGRFEKTGCKVSGCSSEVID